ncbi:MAG: hypothetical protein ABI151_04500 [Chitinophagaceae bacterium]
MIYDYVVTLQNKSRRYVDNTSVLLLLLSVAFFITQIVKQDFRLILLIGTLLLVFLFGFALYQLLIKYRKTSFSRCLMIAGFLWLAMPALQWVGLPLIALGLLETIAKNDLEIGFSANQVVINSMIKRRFNWSDFNQIVLKDDLLTMDFKNNRLIQRMTIDEEADADEDEFNAYCLQHLSKKI